jgi:hypothetical protein
MDGGPFVHFADGVWVDTAPVRIVGMPLTTTMTVLRLPDGGLVLWSPIPMTPERRAAVEALGPVAHVYAPSLFHHRWIGEWAAAFPAARVHAPAKVGKKHAGLRIDRDLNRATPEPALAGAIDEVHVDGFRVDETALVYRPAGVLIVADLVHNIGRPPGVWTRMYSGAMGFYDRVALSRVIRWTGFSDRAAARRSLDHILQLPFDAIVVGHGAPIASGGKQALADAYRWLG